MNCQILDRMNAVSRTNLSALNRVTAREKILLSVGAETCQPTLGFAPIVEDARAHGVSDEDLRAAVRFISYESGYPAAQAAMAKLSPLLAPSNASDEAMRIAATEDVNPLPVAVQERIARIDPRFASFMGLQSRIRRDHLTTLPVRERAFLSMTADVMYQTLGDTFRIHTGRALGAGVDQETVREVVAYLALFGVTRAWNAFDALGAILSDTPAGR